MIKAGVPNSRPIPQILHIYMLHTHTHIYIYVYISKRHMNFVPHGRPHPFFTALPTLSQFHLQSSSLLWVVTMWHVHRPRPVSPLVSYLVAPGWNLILQASPNALKPCTSLETRNTICISVIWGGRVGWGGAITFMSTWTRIECYAYLWYGGEGWGGVGQ